MIRAIATVVSASERDLVVDVPGWPGQRPGQFAMLALGPAMRRMEKGGTAEDVRERAVRVWRAVSGLL